MTDQTHSDDDVPWPVENGNAKRESARDMLLEATSMSGSDPEHAEELLWAALEIAESALYWPEDTDFEDVAHEELHTYGRYVREHFPAGCHLHWNGSGYEITCPVKKAHKRMGLSPTFVGKRICSICCEPASECPHMPDMHYEVPGGTTPAGYCPVCHSKDCVEHGPDQTFRVRASVQLVDFVITGISLVSRPV